MMYPMTRFQQRLLKRICRRLVVQGPDHQKNIIIRSWTKLPKSSSQKTMSPP
jgi:hypothetical protein